MNASLMQGARLFLLSPVIEATVGNQASCQPKMCYSVIQPCNSVAKPNITISIDEVNIFELMSDFTSLLKKITESFLHILLMISMYLVMLWCWLSVFILHVMCLCVYRLPVHTLHKPYMEGISFMSLKVSACE